MLGFLLFTILVSFTASTVNVREYGVYNGRGFHYIFPDGVNSHICPNIYCAQRDSAEFIAFYSGLPSVMGNSAFVGMCKDRFEASEANTSRYEHRGAADQSNCATVPEWNDPYETSLIYRDPVCRECTQRTPKKSFGLTFGKVQFLPGPVIWTDNKRRTSHKSLLVSGRCEGRICPYSSDPNTDWLSQKWPNCNYDYLDQGCAYYESDNCAEVYENLGRNDTLFQVMVKQAALLDSAEYTVMGISGICYGILMSLRANLNQAIQTNLERETSRYTHEKVNEMFLKIDLHILNQTAGLVTKTDLEKKLTKFEVEYWMWSIKVTTIVTGTVFALFILSLIGFGISCWCYECGYDQERGRIRAQRRHGDLHQQNVPIAKPDYTGNVMVTGHPTE